MFETHYSCFVCKEKLPIEETHYLCSSCKGSLSIEYDMSKIKKSLAKNHFKNDPTVDHWKYSLFYPISDLSNVVSIKEGGTRLLESQIYDDVYYKFEPSNPTGAFKDRGTSIEITRAKELGVKKVICASTGNMGASVSAYSARAGINATIYLPSNIPENKIRQIKAYGAKVVRVRGTYDQTVNKTWKDLGRLKAHLTGDYPYRLEGQKSVGYEIVDQMNFSVPDNIVIPIGMGTLFWATYKGLKEFKDVGLIKKMPKLIGVQARGCNPVVKSFKKGVETIDKEKKVDTIAYAIACDKPYYGEECLHAIKKTKGLALDVTDKEIIASQKNLAKEGLYVETSCAATLAGYKKIKNELKGKTVFVLTGNGLKESKNYY